MIVTETALASIFEQLPDVESVNGSTFKPRFDWGTQDVLNKFISLPESISKYPLIWLVNDEENHSVSNSNTTRNTRLIIAKNSDAPDEFNDFQYQTDYKLILDPLLENIIKALQKSGISKIVDYEYTVQRLPNYKEVVGETKTLAIWNAIVFEANIEFKSNRCLKNIKFN